ncbi:MAG: alkaline phosphatase family protein, partial [Candidatus Binatia bacterium]
MIRASLPHLPTFRRLLEEAALFPLRSSAEHISASVWPTMYTGTSPGEHGISLHIQWDPIAMRMRRVSSDWVYSEPFWYDLARAGLGVTALDVPFTFENRLPRAVEVTNWGSHDLMARFQANPPALRREIRRRFGRHPMGYEIPVSKDTRQLVAIQRECVVGAEKKGQLARWLRDTTDWDFCLVVFGECHRGGHILWRDSDEVHGHVPPSALLEVYQAVDRGVGTVLEGVDTEATTVAVFALHGMGTNFSQEHFVRRAMDRVNATFHREGSGEDDRPSPQRGVMRALRESIPAPLQHALARA